MGGGLWCANVTITYWGESRILKCHVQAVHIAIRPRELQLAALGHDLQGDFNPFLPIQILHARVQLKMVLPAYDQGTLKPCRTGRSDDSLTCNFAWTS